jgi:DNA-binding transcriptional MerR regulator
VRVSIGDFARITHLSIRTLRRYHEGGLLEPAEVDPHSGYRYYTLDQVPTAQVISRFRALGLPVREVGEVLAAEPGDRNAVLAAHLDRLQDQLEETRTAVVTLRRLLAPDTKPAEVTLRSAPATTVAAIRATVTRDEVEDWYAGAMASLRAAVPDPTGPAGGLYDHELFTADRGTALVYLPASEPPAHGRVVPYELPAREVAVVTHAGPHDDIDVSYADLGCWVAGHALGVAGPVQEIYLVGPRDTPDGAAWRTEICWPVFRTA